MLVHELLGDIRYCPKLGIGGLRLRFSFTCKGGNRTLVTIAYALAEYPTMVLEYCNKADLVRFLTCWLKEALCSPASLAKILRDDWCQ